MYFLVSRVIEMETNFFIESVVTRVNMHVHVLLGGFYWDYWDFVKCFAISKKSNLIEVSPSKVLYKVLKMVDKT